MTSYDPGTPPGPAWLDIDEADRIGLALEYHRRARVRLPNPTMHAAIHVVVENQVALGDVLPVGRVLDRLQAEGLDRHEAIHAVGSVLVKHMHTRLIEAGGSGGDPNADYWTELGRLTAASWRDTAG